MQTVRAQPGFRVGRYELLRQLGTGATSVVYEAVDRSSGRRFALKWFCAPPSSAREGEAALFLREARAAANVRHPHIVEIVDFGESGGQLFLVMELLKGDTLAALLRQEGKLPLGQALSILLPIASAVGALHSAGIVHRDIKPANILLDGTIPPTGKLSDFGVARLEDDAKASSLSQDVLGTPAYMAPELILFGAGAASERSDQYALAATLYECVTGRRAFRAATSYEIMRSVVAGHVSPPSFVEPTLPEALDDVILRALCSDPGERFSSVADFGRALQSLAPAESAERLRIAQRASTMPPPLSTFRHRARVTWTPRKADETRHLVTRRLDQMVVLRQSKENPSDAEWDECLRLVGQFKADFGVLRILVVTDGGTPSPAQRRRLSEVTGGFPLRAAVVTDSVKVRFVVSSMALFKSRLASFSASEMSKAYAHLGLDADEQHRVDRAIREMGGEVASISAPRPANSR